jgi:predicted O-methyltransferase YrrM
LTPTFTSDWFTCKTGPWLEHVVPRLRQIPMARWLEVGSYEGRSALWMLDHMSPSASVTCVDVFDDVAGGIANWATPRYAKRFDANVAGRNVVKIALPSQAALEGLCKSAATFHGAYLDGDHRRENVARDLELLWPLLLPGAVLVCDDYGCAEQPGARAAIDAFLPGMSHHVLHVDFQMIILLP